LARNPVTGDKELAAALRALAKGPGAREVDGMAKRAMRPLLDDVRARVKSHRNFPTKYSDFFPKQRGKFRDHLDKAIIMRKDDRQSAGGRSYKIGGVRRARYLLHLLEYGTAPHWQPNLNGGFMHPGATPKPSMVPAFEAGQSDVITDFGDEVVDWLTAAGSRVGLRILRGRR
jgi:HK97 gp10 family phage protein